MGVVFRKINLQNEEITTRHNKLNEDFVYVMTRVVPEKKVEKLL